MANKKENNKRKPFTPSSVYGTRGETKTVKDQVKELWEGSLINKDFPTCQHVCQLVRAEMGIDAQPDHRCCS